MGPKRSLSHDPLFQVMYAYHSMPGAELAFDGVEISQIPPLVVSAKADMSLSLQEQGEAISGHVSYRTGLFDAGTIERLMSHYLTLLHAVACSPDVRLFDLYTLTYLPAFFEQVAAAAPSGIDPESPAATAHFPSCGAWRSRAMA